MKLHIKNPQIFKESINELAAESQIPVLFIEKDYWLSLVLKRLSQSKHANEFVFKGGTSLSKAHGLIERFSEDIDLAILVGERSGNQVKNQITNTAKAMTQGLEEIHQAHLTSKHSRFRRTAHAYPSVFPLVKGTQMNPLLVLEINAFGNPHPYKTLHLQSMVGEFLTRHGQTQWVQEYALEPFSIQVLTPERTFGEKVLAMVRASYHQEAQQQLQLKVRHLYDLHLMMQNPAFSEFIESEQLFEMLRSVQSDDACNHEFQGEWAQKPLTESLIFQDHDEIWDALTETYQSSFASLVYGTLPAITEIRASLKKLAQRLTLFDQMPGQA